MTVPEFGAICLGIVVGYFVKFFLRRITKFTLQGLSLIITLTFGGLVVNFLKNDASAFWYYPIGLMLGIAIYIGLGLFLGGDPDLVAFHKNEENNN